MPAGSAVLTTCTRCNRLVHRMNFPIGDGSSRDRVCSDCLLNAEHAYRVENGDPKDTTLSLLDAAIARACNVKGA